MNKIGVVGVPGGWSSERLADVVADRTGYRLMIDMKDVCYDSHEQTAFYKDVDLLDLDALIVKKISRDYDPDYLERIQLLIYLYKRGLKIFSNPESILRLYDRLSCTLALQLGNIPMPSTVVCESIDIAVKTVRRFGKAVCKPLYSSKARGMVLLDSKDPKVSDKIQEFRRSNTVMYLQQMVDIPGKDMGIVFLGGKYICTYARVGSSASWNTTTENGGKYTAYEPDKEIIALAEKAQALFGLDFTSVDVVETSEGPKIFEVSAFGGFRGLKDAHHIDAAELYTDHVISKIK